MPEWFTTSQLVEMGKLSPLIAEGIKEDCEIPGCGCPILNNLEMTKRRCSNYYCYGHMKYRANDMCKRLGIKDIGPETCYKILKSNHLESHFHLLPYILPEGVKPKIHLWEIADMACIPGISKKWEDILEGAKSFEDFFSRPGIPRDIRVFKDNLITASKFFEIKPTLSSRVISVMITGSISGYSPRSKFIETCNDLFGQFVKIKLGEKKQSHDYLITENIRAIPFAKERLKSNPYLPASSMSKMELAIYSSTPIKTPREFLITISELLEEIFGVPFNSGQL